MNRLIFATNNENKVAEIKSLVSDDFQVISLKDAGISVEIPEPHDTLHANASEKSWAIFRMVNDNCFSEDTGLEVAALNGEPGVRSARYAGEEKTPQDNLDKLLSQLKGVPDRQARFCTIISLILNEKEYFFEGICNGHVIEKQRGNNGFGYDSVFVPEGELKTFGEMTSLEKNKHSHRRKAFDKLLEFLSINGNK